MGNKYKESTPGKNLITALQQAVDHEKGKSSKGIKRTKITVAPLPHYKGNNIKLIRNKLGLTQSTFAFIMGVSIKTVEAWESGRNEPQGPAQRMLYLMENDSKILEKYELVKSS
jgi:putative transcriptional regulator